MGSLSPTGILEVITMKKLLAVALLALSTLTMASQEVTINSVWTDGMRNFDLRDLGKYKVKDNMTNSKTECDLTITGTLQGTLVLTNCVIYKGSEDLGTLPTLSYSYTVENEVLTLFPDYLPGVSFYFLLVK